MYAYGFRFSLHLIQKGIGFKMTNLKPCTPTSILNICTFFTSVGWLFYFKSKNAFAYCRIAISKSGLDLCHLGCVSFEQHYMIVINSAAGLPVNTCNNVTLATTYLSLDQSDLDKLWGNAGNGNTWDSRVRQGHPSRIYRANEYQQSIRRWVQCPLCVVKQACRHTLYIVYV